MAKRSINFIEFPAANRQETGRFYADLFGWEIQHQPDPANYTTFQSASLSGGFPDVSEISPAGRIIPYIESNDIDKDLAAVEAHGGKTLVPNSEIPGFGWFGIFADPTGNHVGLYKVLEQPGR